jgi:hypothetical protein
MPHPLKAQKADGSAGITTATLRNNELIDSRLFATIHSTKQTADEAGWMLIVAQKHKSKEASAAFFSKLVKHVCGGTNGQTPIEARSNTVTIPVIEEKEQTKSGHNNFSNLPNAWGSIFSHSNKIERWS